jgi:RHS repeat-associated protein
VVFTWRNTAAVWSYPNLHGDVAAVTDGAGVKQGPTRVYASFGQPLTGNSSGELDNSAGQFDYGWHSAAQRPLEHQCGTHALIEMGARPYDPSTGRFLQVDPIEGGTSNDYVHPTDPVNQADLDGSICWSCHWRRAERFARKAARRVGRRAASVGRTAWRYRDEIALGLAVVGSFACTVCTIAFYSGMALAGASTAVSCARGGRAACALGVVSLAAGGAGRALARVGSGLRTAGAVRTAASRWHPIQRRLTGPLFAGAGRVAGRSGFALGWSSNGLSTYGLRY